jgi:hypothetical protein
MLRTVAGKVLATVAFRCCALAISWSQNTKFRRATNVLVDEKVENFICLSWSDFNRLIKLELLSATQR